MTMATCGKQIEDLAEAEQQRQWRLRYAGAVKTLSLHELRVAAARLIATYPQYSQQEFVREAEEAFREVAGDAHLHARDARHVEVAPADDLLAAKVAELSFPLSQKRRILNILHFADIETVGDLVKRRPSDLLKLPNLGLKMLKTIQVELAARGLKLAAEPTP